MPSRFVHLHTHSHYSLLTALPQIPVLVKKAKEYDMPALALTDNANLYGAIEFYQSCKKNGIKAIIGIDAYVAMRTRHDKQSGVDSRRHRLVLLAKNNAGYHNLVKLVTEANFTGFYYKPRIDLELIQKHAEGLICIFPSFSGQVTHMLRMQDTKAAEELLVQYKGIYGAENVYLELTHHPEIEGHQEIMGRVRALAKSTNTPLVAAHDVYYMSPEDRTARETLMSVQSGGDTSERRSSGSMDGSDDEDFSFISPAQAEEYFKDIPEALDNCAKIAAECNVTLELGKWIFPNYIVESGRTYEEELKHIVYEGLKRRNMEPTEAVMKRVNYELDVIFKKGYPQYFLVVSDLLRFAHENDILTTIRGSVAGSLVTYLAGITNVNPLEYKLPFERFLNLERPSAPDIDMDYADNRRDEMIEYAKRKYGADKVAQIGTFGTMAARGAVRDVTRALGHPYALGDQIAKLIPMGAQGFPMTIDIALETVPDLAKLYKADKIVKEIIDMAKKIEGCARQIGVHAAGVVIAPKPLIDYVPLQFDAKGENKIITQYDMHAVGEDGVGLLKFDFLGIKNLAILSDAVKRVKKQLGVDVDIEQIPIDDKKTFAMLARGETIGLFQLNGSGMTAYLRQLKPTSIFDINAMVALYRPGPMESIPMYIERKQNPMLVTYVDPRLKDILDQSYGVITYQDDVLLTAIHLAGYSWLEADKLRKAMGKKVPEVMEAEKAKLLAGFVKNGLSEENAQKLWKLIEPFAAYGFNKAHAASYGRVAYQTAYMKANFPALYMSAVLTADSGDVEKISEIVAECKRMNIPVLPPSINQSREGFTVVRSSAGSDLAAQASDQIRFGLTTIKNFGEGIAHAIISERDAGGEFTSLANFLDRIKDKNLNRKSLESLIKCGAMDEFAERGLMLANIEDLLAYNKEKARGNAAQDSLFGSAGGELAEHVHGLRLRPAPAALKEDALKWEKELLGLYISGHPLDKFRDKIAAHDTSIKKVREVYKQGMTVVIAGILEEARELLTKKGDKMMFLKISDYSGSIEAVIFPKAFEQFKQHLVQENCIAVKGQLSMRNDTPSIIVDKVKSL
jgi:DNA polymerase-3 subunit alpha